MAKSIAIARTPCQNPPVQSPIRKAGIIPITGPKYGITFEMPANIPINTAASSPMIESPIDDSTATIRASSSAPLMNLDSTAFISLRVSIRTACPFCGITRCMNFLHRPRKNCLSFIRYMLMMIPTRISSRLPLMLVKNEMTDEALTLLPIHFITASVTSVILSERIPAGILAVIHLWKILSYFIIPASRSDTVVGISATETLPSIMAAKPYISAMTAAITSR